jgi:hypothetical protein
MIIYNREIKKIYGDMEIFLTKDEAFYLQSMLNELINKPQIHHIHINNKCYNKELMIAVYSNDNLSEFDKESKVLIETELSKENV